MTLCLTLTSCVCLYACSYFSGQHTGFAPRVGPTKGTLAWSVGLPSSSYLYTTSHPIIGADGMVFDGFLALNSSGVQWSFPSVCGQSSGGVNTWALGAAGLLYGACDNGVIFAASPANASTLWTLQVPSVGFQRGVTLGSVMLYSMQLATMAVCTV